MEQHTLPSAEYAETFESAARPKRASVPAPDATIKRFERAFERTLSSLLATLDGSPVDEQVRWHFGIGCDEASVRGKRLRPRLLFGVAFDEGGTFDGALDAALAIEFLHNYSLVHDDIEDRDLMRRGRETVWARFGLAHGINAGDAVCAVSYLSLLENSSGAPLERVMATARVLQRANFAMCAGQGYDLAFESAPEVTLPAYLAMIDGKTAALFGAACELGALCAGSDEFRARAYAEVGRAYGRAFQIHDDLLGTLSDIARRKWSFPVVWALAGPPSDARTAIATRYAQLAPLDCSDVAAVACALEALGARRASEEACAQQIDRADRLAERYELDCRGTVRGLFA
jgi:geranylgeranyl diphosphate synthase type I